MSQSFLMLLSRDLPIDLLTTVSPVSYPQSPIYITTISTSVFCQIILFPAYVRASHLKQLPVFLVAGQTLSSCWFAFWTVQPSLCFASERHRGLFWIDFNIIDCVPPFLPLFSPFVFLPFKSDLETVSSRHFFCVPGTSH